MTKLKQLSEFSNCLNLQKLEALGRNIQNINLELDQVISKNKVSKITKEEGEKIEDLFQKFKISENSIDELPGIVDRLETLKNLHEESAGLALNLSSIKNVQEYMGDTLENNNELLKKVFIFALIIYFSLIHCT